MGLTPKVLIVSNSTTSGLLWNFCSQARKIGIVVETNRSQVMQRCLTENPDLILIDLDPQDQNELGLISELREVLTTPLLTLYSNKDIDPILNMYEAGADDCIDKASDPEIFMAKVKAWLNRSLVLPAEQLEPLRVGQVSLIPLDMVMALGNACIIHLTNTETRLLYVLMSHPGKTIRTKELIHRIWMGREVDGCDILKSLIYRLRRKLEAEPANLNCILTVPGMGYKFDPSAAQRAVKEESEQAEDPQI